MPPESRYPADWLRIAEKDLARVGGCLHLEDPELAGFCLQQSVEKFLKAFLLRKGWKLRRIHDLAALLDDASNCDPTLDEYRSACQRITNYYVLQRYPLPGGSGPSEAEVRESLAAVEGPNEKVRQAVR